jgi:pimeloyl-ACP methyl ester carboxylesterase
VFWLAVGCQHEKAGKLAKRDDAPAVIVIPGITGSELLDGRGERVWPPRIFSLMSDFESLRCDQEGKPWRALTAGEPVHDYYETMAERLREAGYDVHSFGYDWRLSNAILADRLAALIDKTQRDRVDIVAHSMGGLLAAYYISQHGGGRVRRLVTLGTPYLGTPGAVKTLELGDFVDNAVGYFLRNEFVAIFKNNASWYQLLPSPDYFALTGRGYIRKVVRGERGIAEELGTYGASRAFIASRPWANPTLLAGNEALHATLDLQRTLKTVDAYFIVGDGHETVGKVDFVFDRRDGSEVFDGCEPHVTNGDGSVVLASATIGGRTESIHPGHTYFVSEEHSELFTSEVVIRQVRAILSGGTTPVTGVRRLPERLDEEEPLEAL